MYRSLISLMPKAQPLLLDLFPNAAVAYSLRKLRTAYSGAVVRVRRSVDNAEQDFLDTELNDTLTDWVGYNLWTYSEDVSTWGLSNTTITTNAVVAPDGNTTADIAYETATNSNHLVFRQQLPVTVGKEYTVSFWVKPNGRNFMALNVAANLSNNNGAVQPLALFDLINGTKISDNGLFRLAPTITLGVNGWCFITYGVIANVTTSPTALQISFRIDAVTGIYVGDVTKGIAIWGSQISETSTVKSYQKTEATAGGGGFVTTWYDQSGNGNNATQTTAGRQPIIVSSGAILTRNGKQYARMFQGATGAFMEGLLNTPIATVGTSSFLVSSYNSTTSSVGFSLSSTSSSNQYLLTGLSNASPFRLIGIFRNITEFIISGLSVTLNQMYLTSMHTLSSNNRLLFINNTNSYSSTSSSNSLNATYVLLNRVRRSDTISGFVDLFEFIVYSTEKTTDRTAIETNINSHYNIYP